MRRIILLGLVVLVVVLGWTGAWFYGAQLIRDEITALADAAPSVTCGRLDIAGFPFRFDVTCSEARIVEMDLAIATPEIKATVLAYRPNQAIAFVQSPVSISDAFAGSERELRFSLAEASLRFSGLLPQDWELERLSLLLDGPVLHDVLIGDEIVLSASKGELHVTGGEAAGQAADGLAAFISAEGLDYPEWDISGGAATLTGSLTHFPRKVFDWFGDDLLREWQAAGGQLRLDSSSFASSEMTIEATGEARLDEEGLPGGSLRVVSKGLIERLDLSFLGDMRPLLIGAPDGEGRYTNLIALRDGFIMAGVIPVPIFELALEPFF
jgi:hypothetical protein